VTSAHFLHRIEVERRCMLPCTGCRCPRPRLAGVGGLDGWRPGAKTGAVSTVEPWYTKPWRSTANGTRARGAAFGYLSAGVVFVILCLLSSAGPTARVFLLAIALLFLWLGASLAATLRLRRGT